MSYTSTEALAAQGSSLFVQLSVVQTEANLAKCGINVTCDEFDEMGS